MDYVEIETGFGRIRVNWIDGILNSLRFGELDRRERKSPVKIVAGCTQNEEGDAVVRDLLRYFSGESISVETPVRMDDYTPFQRGVWKAVRDIPYGETRTYGGVGRGLGRPGAARSVGGALGQNPWPVVIPCHRVVGAKGALIGFAYGTGWKSALLELERGTLW